MIFQSFDTSKINEYVNKREIFNEDGFKISEWIVKTKSFLLLSIDLITYPKIIRIN